MLEQRGALALVQAGEREEVGRAVAELGEEAGDVLRRVVGANDQEAALASDGVLRHHAQPGLYVALVEVAEAVHPNGGGDLRVERVGGGLDVHGDGLVGADELERELRVVLVGLHAVREADRDERGLGALGATPLHRELGEPARKGRILSAGDAQHEAGRA